ncbi:glycosyl hydrolase family 18 protein [Lactococcus garvieae]|uniref:chitinase n=1 Tax=Lactococcus garvieae TaxID=1363 RepID=A0A1I4I299_9LACT|nr:glycosyl hydrolase family 18 protein [Lactococcus garvieae]SFL47941.1 chitinase [Lactococcus garvieae]
MCSGKSKIVHKLVASGLLTLSSIAVLGINTHVLAEQLQNSIQSEVNRSSGNYFEEGNKQAIQPQYRNVMYYGNWSIWGGQGNQYPEDLPANLYTHLNFSFVDFDAQGNLISTDEEADLKTTFKDQKIGYDSDQAGIISALTAVRKQNPNMKLGVTLGGWSKSGDFSTVAANKKIREKFVNNIIKFVKATGMDFVDIDWEYPTSVRKADKVDNSGDEGTPNATQSDRENYIQLMQDLRNALNKLGKETSKTYELSAALPADDKKLEAGVDVEKLFKIIDFGNMMTYDLHGAWEERSGHQSALYSDGDASENPKDAPDGRYSIDRTVKYLEKHHVDMSKVDIGVANYTRGWADVEKGSDVKYPGLFQKASKKTKDADGSASYGAENEDKVEGLAGASGRNGGIWAYRNIDKLKKREPSLKEYWDDKAKAPYLYSDKTKEFYTFDNVRSVKEKANYVKEHHLGGMISWMASEDKEGKTGKRDELARTIKEALFGEQPLPSIAEDSVPKLNITVDRKIGKGYGNDKQYVFTIRNNEKVSDTGFLGEIIKRSDTIKKPTVVITMKDGSTLKQGAMNGSGIVSEKDGKTYVDLSGIWGMDYIEPGSSVELKLAPKDGKGVSLDNVKKISIDQYYVTSVGKTKLSSQTIYNDHTTLENDKPTISGVENQKVRLGEPFDPMKGITAFDKKGDDLTNRVVVSGHVDVSKEGEYLLTYSVTDSNGNKTEVKRYITVVKQEEQVPTFKGLTNSRIFEGDKFNPLEGVSAIDSHGNDLTAQITFTGKVNTQKAGQYTIEYTVSDNQGETATAKRSIEVVKEAVPTIEGVKNQTIPLGSTFDVMNGISAIDGRGNKIDKNSIKVSGNVDTGKTGEYKLTYTATAKSGLQSSVTCIITVQPKEVDSASEMVNPKNQVMVGYWHNWSSKSDGYDGGTARAINLTDIDRNYNVVDVSFMKASEGNPIPTFKPYNQTDEAFRKQVGQLNAQGRSVLLSLGGADAHIELTSKDKDAFVAEIIRMVDTYGFDGIDLDLEQGAITAAENQKVIPAALREVKEHYAQEGKNFLITMAPEFPCLKAKGAYAAYISNLDGFYDWINPQYYNQGGDGVSGPNGKWLAQNNDGEKEDFLYYLTSALINGTDGYTSYVKIPANKLVIGLPANKDAAGSGYVSNPKALEGAMSRLDKAGNKIKGLMTWSVNWDDGVNAAGENYNWSFVHQYDHLIDYDGSDNKDGKVQLLGLKNETITIGDKFAPMNGVSATDVDGKNITSKIKIDGNVNTSQTGIYTLIYSVEGQDGKKISQERTITVVAEKIPEFKGVNNVTLKVGEAFNPLAGVSAIDARGNNITSSITVSGAVNTQKVGVYTLTYTVTSSSGNARAIVVRTVTVQASTSSLESWSSSRVYTGGEKVLYKGKEYRAKWWTQNNVPDQSGANGPWEELLDPNHPAEWSPTRAYVGGTEVTYNGNTYRAKWWTQGDVPDAKSDANPWSKVNK